MWVGVPEGRNAVRAPRVASLVLLDRRPLQFPPFFREGLGGSQGEASNREQASPTPCLRKKGGTAGDDDREGLGWPPRELALLFVLPEHQSTTIPPLLRKKLGAERKKGRKQHEREREISNASTGSQGGGSNREQAFPPPCLHKNGGNYKGR